jgi:hypothetical protein
MTRQLKEQQVPHRAFSPIRNDIPWVQVQSRASLSRGGACMGQHPPINLTIRFLREKALD